MKNIQGLFFFTNMVMLIALGLLPSSLGKACAQKSEAATPQVFKAQDKLLAVLQQPDIPVAVVAVRNLENDWLKDLEIEIENKSGKPIYFLSIDFIFPDIPLDEGREYGWSLFFGNPALMQIQSKASSQDIAIGSGQRQSLKVTEYPWQGLQHYIERKGFSIKNAKRIIIRFSEFSFGDGTGFMAGVSFPAK